MKKQVTVCHTPNNKTIWVLPFTPINEPRQNRSYAQFNDQDHTMESVIQWVRNNPKMTLVCGCSGKPV
jgi:hypothetical protein